MESLDLTNKFLAKNRDTIPAMAKTVQGLKAQLFAHGFSLKGSEPLKITIDAKEYGYTGDEIAKLLLERNIILEYHDENYIVAMVSVNTSSEALTAFRDSLFSIKKKAPLPKLSQIVEKPVQAIKPSIALYMDSEKVPAAQAVGRILAKTAVSCPPCVPIYIAGEVITKVPETEYVKVLKP